VSAAGGLRLVASIRGPFLHIELENNQLLRGCKKAERGVVEQADLDRRLMELPRPQKRRAGGRSSGCARQGPGKSNEDLVAWQVYFMMAVMLGLSVGNTWVGAAGR
jgi:hypothetical protein